MNNETTLSAQEIKAQMTQGPWSLNEFEEDNEHGAVYDKGNARICDCADSSANTWNEEAANAAAIVSAVNNTYGKGYDPAATHGLVKALQEARREIVGLWNAIEMMLPHKLTIRGQITTERAREIEQYCQPIDAALSAALIPEKP